MRRNVKLFGMALAAVIILLSVSGITFSRLENQRELLQESEAAPLQVVYEQAEEGGALKFGHWYPEAASVLNASTKAVYVRVHVQIPQVDGKPVFYLGKTEQNSFTYQNFDEPANNQTEYWEQVGDYLYYRNTKTENRLKPGTQSAQIYEAVQLNHNLSSQALAFFEEQNIVILVEYAEQDWARVSQ